MVLGDFDIAKLQKHIKTIDFIDLFIKKYTKTVKKLLTLFTCLMKIIPKLCKTTNFIYFCCF